MLKTGSSLFLLACVCSLTACTTSMKGTIQNGQYDSASHLFSVNVPQNIPLAELEVNDGARVPDQVPEFADFTYDGYPMISGLYSVEFRIVHKAMSAKEFAAMNIIGVPQLLNQMSSSVTLLTKPVCQPLTIMTRQAYQCITTVQVDGQPALGLATAVNFDQAIALFKSLLPINQAEQATASRKPELYKNYTNFVQSFKSLQ